MRWIEGWNPERCLWGGRAGSAVDREALRRGNSVYMVGQVVPMLPRPLCEELCSLVPGVPRLTFSIVWEVTQARSTILDSTPAHDRPNRSHPA